VDALAQEMPVVGSPMAPGVDGRRIGSAIQSAAKTLPSAPKPPPKLVVKDSAKEYAVPEEHSQVIATGVGPPSSLVSPLARRTLGRVAAAESKANEAVAMPQGQSADADDTERGELAPIVGGLEGLGPDDAVVQDSLDDSTADVRARLEKKL